MINPDHFTNYQLIAQPNVICINLKVWNMKLHHIHNNLTLSSPSLKMILLNKQK